MSEESLRSLKGRIQSCTLCAINLPHDPRPVTSFSAKSRILIIGQAPGRIVHESGVPWKDASGKLLRTWLSVSEEEFYDPDKFALMPMGFCFPGKGTSGDMAPRPECAPQWHELIRIQLRHVKHTLLIGRYSQEYYLKDRGFRTLTENVQNFTAFSPEFFPLPHPSPRNRRWFANNPWFDTKLLPVLQRKVSEAIED